MLPQRRARFLVTVLVHSGVFIERQYRAFAGIAHGQNTRDFVTKLVSRGYATAITPLSPSRSDTDGIPNESSASVIGSRSPPNERTRRDLLSHTHDRAALYAARV